MEIYVRKNEISDGFLRDILKTLIEKKQELEKNFELRFTSRYVTVIYKGHEFYYDRRTAVLYPVFERYEFKKINIEDFEKRKDEKQKISMIRAAFPNVIKDKSLFNVDKFGLMTESHYQRSFWKERMKFACDGIINGKNEKLDCFFVQDSNTKEVKGIDSNMHEVDAGYVIPVIDLDPQEKDSEYRMQVFERELKFLEENGVKPLFEKPKLRKKYEELVKLCNLLETYGVEEGRIDDINRDAMLNDIDNGRYSYSLNEYKKKLLNIEKIRIDADPYDEEIFKNSKRGHWDLFYNPYTHIHNREVIKIKTDELLYPRDPKLDIKEGGLVAIDFGTKSTVVAVQEKNDRKMLARIGGGSYRMGLESHQYENPTVMEFVDIESFMKDYRGFSGRPFTKWKDLKISHTAASDFLAGPESVIEGLKQWCGDKQEFIIIHDKAGKKIKLKPYSDLTDEDIDPIELYAYYIGSYINNMHTGNIFMNYILSFPITYEQEIREKMLASFERGIKKSFPVAVLDNKNLMETFSINNGTNEPTAYFLCAMKEYKILPEVGKEKFYGVFDFGGGTTDFSFGSVKKIEKRRYECEVKHFAENGNKYLGGENILNSMAYEVFKENRDLIADEDITFYCPLGCEKFDGFENILIDSYESKYNMRQMCNVLRDLWEEIDVDKYETGMLNVTLMKSSTNQSALLTLNVDSMKLQNIIRVSIEKGIESFIAALKTALKSQYLTFPVEKMDIFLAGNSSRHSYVKEIFDEKIAKFKEEYRAETGKEIEFNIYPPLGTDESRTLQQQLGIDVTEEGITGKTGVAYGLLEVRGGGKIRILSEEDMERAKEPQFPYYVGYSVGGNLQVVLDENTENRQWVKLMTADAKKTDIYYSDSPLAAGGISTNDSSVRRKTIEIKEIDEDAYIYIRRVKHSDTIEYAVAYEDEIVTFEYLENPKKLKL